MIRVKGMRLVKVVGIAAVFAVTGLGQAEPSTGIGGQSDDMLLTPGAGHGNRNFRVTQLPSGEYRKLTLAPGQAASLTELGVSAASLPTLAMVETYRDQTSCAGATLTLTYMNTVEKNHR